MYVMSHNFRTLYNQNQLLKFFQKKNLLKYYFLKKKFPWYGNCLNTPIQTSKYNSFCFYQGQPKRTLKIYQHNRHMYRDFNLRSTFTSTKSQSW